MGGTQAENDRIERALRAEIALLRGRSLSEVQKLDIDWLRRRRHEETLQSISRAEYIRLAGVTAHIAERDAKTFGLPIGRGTVDVSKVIAAVHQLLAKHSKFFESSEEAAAIADEERKLKLAAARQKMEREDLRLAQERGKLVNRDDVKGRLAWLVGKLQQFGDKLAAEYGEEARSTNNEFLEMLAKEIEAGALNVDRKRH